MATRLCATDGLGPRCRWWLTQFDSSRYITNHN
eukprot:IDg7566t1